MTVENYIKKAEYNKGSGTIFSVDNGSYNRILDIRGWGYIQNLFKDKNGHIKVGEASDFQDKIGEWIADAINQKIENNFKEKQVK